MLERKGHIATIAIIVPEPAKIWIEIGGNPVWSTYDSKIKLPSINLTKTGYHNV